MESARLAVSTSELARAEDHYTAVFPTLHLQLEEGDTPFRFEHRVVSDGLMAVHRLRCTGRLTATGPLPGTVASARCRSSRRLRYGGQAVTSALPFLRPTGSTVLDAVDADLALVAFDADALLAFTARAGDGSQGPAERLRGTARRTWGLVMDQLDTLAAVGADLPGDLFEAAAWSVHRAFADPFAAAGPESRAAVPRALRRALEIAEARARHAPGVAELAAAAGVSSRTLQTLFRRELGTTPQRHLLDLRLDGARAALLEDPAPSVTDAARQWGFVNLGRFAAAYRERHGENPAATRRGDGRAYAGHRPERDPADA